jgi:uncharacterized RDD family membrane protein YckC
MKGRLEIRTPEGLVFALPLAGPVARFLALLVDTACVMGASMLLGLLLGLLGVVGPEAAQAVGTLAFFVIQTGYGMAAEWLWRGQTVGKRVLKLRVVDASGLRLRLHQVVIRNLLRFVDALPMFYAVGGAAVLFSRHYQRLGDLAANTVVVRLPKVWEPDLERLMGGKFNSLRAHPHLVARLRQRVSPDEAAVALQALLRRDEIEDRARIGLFAELAEHFRSLVEFPPDCTEGIADEQYVRNVVDVLFRTKREETAIRTADDAVSGPV